MQQIIETKGNRAVVINGQPELGYFWACLYVNARGGIQNADITPLRWKGKTLDGAKKWAAKHLASA